MNRTDSILITNNLRALVPNDSIIYKKKKKITENAVHYKNVFI